MGNRRGQGLPYPVRGSMGNAVMFKGRGAENIVFILSELGLKGPLSIWDIAKSLLRNPAAYHEIKKKEAVVFRLVVGRRRTSSRTPGLVDRGYLLHSSDRLYRGKKVALYSLTLKGLVATLCSNPSVLSQPTLGLWVDRYSRSHLVYHLFQKLSEGNQETLVENFHNSLVNDFTRGLLNLELVDDQLVCEAMLFVLRRVIMDAEEKNGSEYGVEVRKIFARLLQEQQASGYWYKIDNATMVEIVSLFCSRERAV